MRTKAILLLLTFLMILATGASPSASGISVTTSSADELIAAVNALRIANGLAPYQTNSILMRTAQNQADYMASIGTWTHTGPDGSRPYQRALAAGYPVAGDLSQGGWFSENVILGIDLTAEGAVIQWQGDAPHLGTMLSTTLRDIGAGVAVVGNTYYYVIDCGLSTGGTPVAYTPPAYLPSSTVMPSTPNPDGSIIHIVQKGESLLGIAFTYGVPMSEILTLNGLTATSTIYEGETIYIRLANTPTPTPPTSTPSPFPTATSWPTSTPTATMILALTTTPLTTNPPRISIPEAGGITLIIILVAMGLAGFLSFSGRKQN